MKRVILLLGIMSMGFQCEPDYDAWYNVKFKIENGTEHNLTVEVDKDWTMIDVASGRDIEMRGGQALIRPGEERVVFGYSGWYYGGPVEDRYSQKISIMHGAELKIDGKTMPEGFWRRQYWDFVDDGKGTATYSIALTEEFINKIAGGPYSVSWAYFNECSADITIVSGDIIQKIIQGMGGPIWEPRISYRIAPGEVAYYSTHADLASAGPFELTWNVPMSADGRDSVVVTMGDRQVVHRRWLHNPLYDSTAYKYRYIPERGMPGYEWTFTDDFFNAAETVK